MVAKNTRNDRWRGRQETNDEKKVKGEWRWKTGSLHYFKKESLRNLGKFSEVEEISLLSIIGQKSRKVAKY